MGYGCMKYVSRYVDGDVPRIFLIKLHKLWSKVRSRGWTPFIRQKIFISDLNGPTPSHKLNNKVKMRGSLKLGTTSLSVVK